MPGGGQPIVVGGGIQLTGGAINEYLFLTSITPPTATTSPRIRIVTSVSPNQVVAETIAGREDTVIGLGSSNTGIGAVVRRDVILGTNISVSHGSSGVGNAGVFIGSGITQAAGSGTANVIINPNGFTATLTNSSNVVINGNHTVNSRGSTVVIGGQTGSDSVVAVGIGSNAGASSVVAIGAAASATQSFNIAIGASVTAQAARCIVIGQGHGAPNADQIKIGHNGQNAGTAGQILIGNGIDPNSVGASEICMGNEQNNTTVGFRFGQNQHTTGVVVPAYTLTWKSALGTNIAAGSVTFVAPKATGNAAAGSFIFQTSPPGASGATLQTATTRLTIDPNGGVTLATPSAAAENLVIAGFGGAGQASIRLNNLTNGAGAAAGTLTNAPSAGDPNFWIPVNIAGTVRFVPAW